MGTHFEYEGYLISIIPCNIKDKTQYRVVIDGNPVFFVYSADTAKRLATRFVDVIEGSTPSRQLSGH